VHRPGRHDIRGGTCQSAVKRDIFLGVKSKRVLDLVVGSLALTASLPILVGVALAMRLSGDQGSFLFRAIRVGEGGRPFIVLKVRTMRAGATGPAVTGARDVRVTPIGRILRRYRIDELPQLVSVVRGEMSLVGPRPEDPAFVDLSNPIHRRVFTARPGISGLAQLQFHREADLLTDPDPERRYREEILPAKLAFDLAYLDHQSLRLDIQILLKTVQTVLKQRAGRAPTPSDPCRLRPWTSRPP
jgi:lipopolysaccharide/colanic/teichoic acid biosynthesis glycosyltransferase